VWRRRLRHEPGKPTKLCELKEESNDFFDEEEA